jgi:hypothetical protein
MSKRKFTWLSWNYDDGGDSYVIAKSECPDKTDLADYIAKADRIYRPYSEIESDIYEGWCAFQCRTDWEDGDGTPQGFYVVETYEPYTKRIDGKRKPGWFPVWLIRKGEWY